MVSFKMNDFGGGGEKKEIKEEKQKSFKNGWRWG
jgi:hypothetical protein